MILLLSLITLYHIKNNKCVLIIVNLFKIKTCNHVCPLLCPPEAKVDVRLMSIKKKPLKIKGFRWWD